MDADPNNQDLIDAKNTKQQEFDTAAGKIADQVTAYETKRDAIQGKLDTYNEKVAEKADAREQSVVDDTADILYGREADQDNNIDAIVGLIDKVRQAEKAANQANLALAQAEKALSENKDPE